MNGRQAEAKTPMKNLLALFLLLLFGSRIKMAMGDMPFRRGINKKRKETIQHGFKMKGL